MELVLQKVKRRVNVREFDAFASADLDRAVLQLGRVEVVDVENAFAEVAKGRAALVEAVGTPNKVDNVDSFGDDIDADIINDVSNKNAAN